MLTEILQNKNINLTKLSELTGISERYLEALVEEKFEKLPASPYVRSYLFKIAEVLDLEGQKLWQDYQKNTQLKKSGVNDRLPLNRYRPESLNKTIIFLIIIIILLLGYLIFRYNFFLGKPGLSLTGRLANSPDNFVFSEPVLKIEGRVKPGDQLMINKEKNYVDENGYFQKDFSLQTGLNIIQFQIKRFLGRETLITKQVLYLPKNEN
jgi:hypothetical protein